MLLEGDCDSRTVRANMERILEMASAQAEVGRKLVIVHGGGRIVDNCTAARFDARHIMNGAVSAMNESLAKGLEAEGLGVSRTGTEVSAPVVYASHDRDGEGFASVKSVDAKVLKSLLRRSDVVVLSCLGRLEDLNYYGMSRIRPEKVAAAIEKALHPQEAQ